MTGVGTRETDACVLVVGGGLVGLSLAVFLSWHRVPVVVVERRSGALIHPRARTINPRSVELYRQVGLAGTILDNRSFTNHSSSILFRAETLAGPERFRAPLDPPESIGDVSPCPWAPIDQDKLEAILSARAVQTGATVHFGTELRGFEQDDDGVDAVLLDRSTGAERTVRAEYLIAADGHRGRVREWLGIATHGHGTIGHTMTLVFAADLTGPLRGRRLGVCHLDTPSPGTVLLSHDGDRRWVFSAPYHPDRGEALADFDERRCVEMIRAAIGVPDLAVEIVPQLADGTTVLGYELAARVADRFRQGRVFLAGDSAHVMPPTGAFGASTGIADAHNLAWKLAAVRNGWAGQGLLDSYDAERRPVAELTVGQALLQLWKRTDPGSSGKAVFSPLDYYATVFGYRYDSTAVVVDAPSGSADAPSDSGEDVPAALHPRKLTGQPGTRAPHVVVRRVEDRGAEVSTLDLFGRSFVLLAGPQAGAWFDAARSAGPAVSAHRLGTDLVDVEDRWPQAHGVGAAGAVLVRPDGFVAWRAPGAPDGDAAGALAAVLDRLLDRRT